MTKLYGIPNCDTVKKAKKWLTNENISYDFHDFKKQGLEQNKVESWLAQLDWQKLLNKRGLTWRQLDQQTKDAVNEQNVAKLLVAHPTLIKRPVVEHNDQVSVGFNDAQFTALFKD
ncbi:ArsC family reductase [Gayadomonas joobiniege]|uniref:ArsC family reductase n=1 Tax=Gayadomonas joobiniege TaxID=1234606 RepID=UPI000474F4AC|nr:ArsC family reductase [Gayadomonas joobiniege]